MADVRIIPAASVIGFTSSLNFSSSLTQAPSGSLVLYGSGSVGRTDLFAIEGNNGRLFEISDDLSDVVFSANTISGLPVIEALSDYTVNLGAYSALGSTVNITSSGAIIRGGFEATGSIFVGYRLGVQTNNPQHSAHIIGKVYATGDIQGLGTGYFGGDVIAYYSDERLKKDVVPIESALEKISRIGGYYYKPNELALQLRATEDPRQKLGVLAQEIQKVFPEAIEKAPFDMDHDGSSISGEDYLTVKYERLVPVLIEAIKELHELIKNK
jgi:hypothetical protein